MKKRTSATKIVLKKLAKNNLLWLLSILTIVHIIILSIYFQKAGILPNKNIKYSTNHPLLLLAINAIQTSNSENVREIANSLATYNFKANHHRVNISIDSQPKWDLRFNKGTSTQNVLAALPKGESLVYLSYQVDKNLWLNYHEFGITKSYNIALLLIFIEMVLVGLILFYNFSLQRFRIPLKNFKESAERLGIDVNATPVPVYGDKLARETASAMNKMQIRLQDLINTRTKMLAAISHDLRTPITRLKLRAYLIGNEEQAKKMVADLDEMEAMINGVLVFAREDFTRERKIIFDLNALLAAICDDHADQNHNIHAHLLKQRLPFLGSPLALKRTFNNLIQNALKYGNEVWLKLKCTSENIIIEIEDNGPGIPKQELNNVFQAYYRVQSTTIESSTGAGLGLTIAHEIIHAHRGTIKLKNRPNQSGLCVIITLPANTYSVP